MTEECAFCGAKDQQLRFCAGCGQRRYCKRSCLRAAWLAGHKEECKQLRAAATSSALQMCCLMIVV